MDPGAGVRGGGHQPPDRHLLRTRRTGGDEVGVRAAVERGGVDLALVLGVHDQQRVEPGQLGQRVAEPGVVEVRELLDPGGQQEALEAHHPGVVQRGQVGDVARDGAAPEPDVDVDPAAGGLLLDLAAPRPWSSAGTELSGMSTTVVTPPAAAARVAEANPSHSVRPGSLTWTWVSTRPGSSTSSAARSTLRGSHRPTARVERLDPAVPDAHGHRALGAAHDRTAARTTRSYGSAATVGRVAVRAQQQRHVVVLVGRDAEADHDLGAERAVPRANRQPVGPGIARSAPSASRPGRRRR